MIPDQHDQVPQHLCITSRSYLKCLMKISIPMIMNIFLSVLTILKNALIDIIDI